MGITAYEPFEAEPATTVQSATSFDLSPVVGTSTDYAREDHEHGTPSAEAATPSFVSVMKWGSD